MKKVIIIAGISSLILGACTTSRLTTYNDDVYASPSEERLERQRIAAQQKKHEEEEARRQQEEQAAQKAKDDANPYYKTPSYNKDDYYDYEYASRVKRFNNPVNGLGYYDNYYTNSYWYNNNPYSYGNSIYSTYNFWGPSYGYSPYYGSGLSLSYGYGGYGSPYGYSPYSYGYSPYGYGYGCSPYSYGYSPYGYGYGYSPYGYGYNNGFYNGMYGYPYGYSGYGYGSGGWGYFNSFDVNSNYGKVATYAPRGSHDGGNGVRESHPNMKVSEDGSLMKYVQSVQSAQATTPKFDPELRNVRMVRDNGLNQSGATNVYFNNGGNTPRSLNDNPNYNGGYTPRGNHVNNGQMNSQGSPSLAQPGQGSYQGNQPVKIHQREPGKFENSQQEVKPSWNSPSSNFPSNQGYSDPGPRMGGSSPGGGGGGGRPR